jgi:hypothetical protein
VRAACLLLAIAGFALPHYLLAPFPLEHGLHLVLLVGPSFALPLFLFVREGARERRSRA